ncbi:zinc-dependent metalloprotease [Phormidium sp. CCY1219]|uniref:zinc-dependent metalloprotease n=1 Tax=Phormidium sp. CCY1219 TaxID=2886104 RepID=UPI002D1EDFF4|nr:zinc-dependent metalloprotease [Phormidium sp. CCY1219]MEB3830443.1 zinc-dependent metalloprotease [Phormidium sp. CCY1219]
MPVTWSMVPVPAISQMPIVGNTAQKNPPPPPSEEEESFHSDLDSIEKFDEVVEDSEKLEGLFTLYHQEKTGKVYMEIMPEQLDKNFLAVMTLASGIGERGLFRGMPLQDMLFYFKRVNENLQFVVRNVYFRARPGDPVERSLDRSFSDSVLSTLPIESKHPERESLLVDLSNLLINQRDLTGLSGIMPWFLGASYSRDSESSYFDRIQAFPLNVEIECVYGFSGGDEQVSALETLPDNRAFNLHVNYSISEVPVNNGYRPRLADNRVGYFITAYQDLSDRRSKETFVRYINRWHLEKQNPNARLSPPKKPIVFWIENTVPLEYRDAIAEGIEQWNKAFEKAGFINAIEAREMPDDATWDPSDIRYNTIRWSTAFESWFAGVGPSRVNPLTGEILDADILIDGNIVRSIKREYRSLVEREPSGSEMAFLGKMMGDRHPCMPAMGVSTDASLGTMQMGDRSMGEPPAQVRAFVSDMVEKYDLCYGIEAPQQLAIGAFGLSVFHNALPSGEEMEQYINQYLTFLTAHEVGHTLGLRHNFHGSTMLQPEELHDTTITRSQGLVASVMDYVPVNLAGPDREQGDFYPVVVGPYDEWAIEYGYKPLNAMIPAMERRELEEIAARAGEDPHLAYAPDEDTMDILNPAANAFDLSGDMVKYSEWQLENAREMWERLDKRYPVTGESFSEVRRMFDMVFFYYFRNAMNATLYVGGQWFNRNHADGNGRLPFQPISVEKQRQSLALLQQYVFDKDALHFSAQLLNKLAPDRWYHWGSLPVVFPLDYPIHQRINLLQGIVLRSLLSYPRLMRLQDLELKASPGEALTIQELFDTLQTGIWTEAIEPEDDMGEISSVRRDLQRDHLAMMMAMVLRKAQVPDEARTLAWYNLQQLRQQLDRTLDKRGDNLDTATKAHLAESIHRIDKTLEAQLQSR